MDNSLRINAPFVLNIQKTINRPAYLQHVDLILVTDNDMLLRKPLQILKPKASLLNLFLILLLLMRTCKYVQLEQRFRSRWFLIFFRFANSGCRSRYLSLLLENAFFSSRLFGNVGLIVAECESHIDEIGKHVQGLIFGLLFTYHIRCNYNLYTRTIEQKSHAARFIENKIRKIR